MSKLKGNEIVISGISGIFPSANNMQVLSENLYNKVDMVSRISKYPGVKHPELPQYYGTVENMKKFDPHFFRVTSNQAKCVEPLLMKILEQTLCALFDAGINPETLKSKKVGVFIACTNIDSVNYFYSYLSGVPLILTGCCQCMLANRISYWLDTKGPSYTFNQGCVGSISALEKAYSSLKNDEIECAIVGGCNYIVKPELTLNMKRAGLLCLDGKTKCFDKNADGFVRSDAVNILILQKAKDAKRVYSEVYHVKEKYFSSPDGSFSFKRDPKDVERFLEEFYSEIGVNPKDVDYIEANSSGIAEADANELEAIGNFFATEKPLNIGSVKSNMGNTESASGTCSAAKLCLAYQKGQIPGNLHFEEPQLQIRAVNENKLQVVTENVPFNRTFAGINNFCYTGSNFHALFKGHYTPKDNDRYKSPIPRLVLVSSRLETAVYNILDILESNPIDPEQLALLNNIYKINIPGYTARGYTIIDTKDQKTIRLSRGFDYISGTSRPICFLYSGMGSQWVGMGEGLLKIPIFARSMERYNKVLLRKGLDIIDIITNKDPNNLDIRKSLVAINAVQIGLTDILKSIGIQPDMMIGHSLGEIACAYADGALTTEETILTTYYRALVSYETKLIKGAMAAVGIGYQEAILQCPPEIEVACHNSADSCTLSGPAKILKEFVKKLQSQGIFAKEVESYDIAFHSRYIQEAGLPMQNLLKQVLPQPKLRSNKWLSTCYLPEDWQKPECNYASPEYFMHNMMSSVLFEEAARLIPKDAIIIEIAPHGLLQAIMKRSHRECANISLTKRGESDTVKFLLNAIGNLYKVGVNPDLELLYPKVEYPVSTETAMLSHLLEWDYSNDWLTDFDSVQNENKCTTKEYIISLHDEEFAFLKQHTKNGVNNFPEAAVLVFVWDTLASYMKKDYNNTPVVFHNVKFYFEASFLFDEIMKLEVSVQKCSGKFEVLHESGIIAGGIICEVKKPNKPIGNIMFNENDKHLMQDDIYTLLRLRGYSYEEKFQLIKSMNIGKNKATVIWRKQVGWINFLDSIFKMQALSEEHDGVSYIKLIDSLTINTDVHKYLSFISDGDECYNTSITKNTGITECGGVIIKDMVLEGAPKFNFSVGDSSNLLVKVGTNKLTQQLSNNHVPTNGRSLRQRTKLIASKGNLESFSWVDAPVDSKKMTVQVHYSGLSLRDVNKLASSGNHSFGMDFSGVDQRGHRVMGLVPCDAAATTVEIDYNNDLLWPVPQHWSLADASTVPLPYIHAFYCLAIRHTVSKNQTILVIGAAGALGQAVISIALHIGCRIYATVGNADKKKFLLRLFPELDENNIGYTYDGSFRAMVIEKTKNRRCNVVISTADGKIREDAMDCVGEEILNNFFLDVNESDQYKNENFTMAYLDGDKTYKAVNLSLIFEDKFRIYQQILHHKLAEGITEGYVRPLTRVIYSPLDVSKAFKVLSNRCNRGRVIINVKDLGESKHNMSQIPRIVLNPKKAYIVICDGSELGVELVSFLIERGAKRLVIHCSPKCINGYFHVRYAAWKNKGISIEINSDELQCEEKCYKFVEDVKYNMGFADVDGIFVTCNGMFKRTINNDVNKMALIVNNLDRISRGFENLRLFSVINAVTKDSSDIESTLCHRKESNELETCCLRRSHLGLPSLFLQHTSEEKIWTSNSLQALFSGLETSLKEQFVSVATFSLNNDITSGNENTKFDAGFGAFYRNISNDELESIEPIVQMKTNSNAFCEDELMVDPEISYFILIPGFESNAQTFAPITELLKKPAIALQMNIDYEDNVDDIAVKLLNDVKRRFHIKTPFHLVGYSFGVNVALEMAALLEKEGLTGVVYCLDSSPDAVRIHLDAYLGNLTEAELQNSLIEHVFFLFVGCRSNELKLKLKQITNWAEKIKTLTNMVKMYEIHTHEYISRFLETAYRRIIMAKEYKPSFVLDSELVLLKGIAHPNATQLNDDYNLSSVTKKKVKVFNIKSDHAMALYDCEIPYIINSSSKNTW